MNMVARTELAATEYTILDQERMGAAQRYFMWQARMAKKELGDRILEVGCGIGNFTSHLLDRELVVATDVELDCVVKLVDRLDAPPNITARQIDVLDPDFCKLSHYCLDSAVCLNVLEHVSDDYQALHNIAAVLPEGGRLALMVPAFEELYGPIDIKLGHYRRYSRRSLNAVAEAAGFRAANLRYMNLPGFFGWWLNARVLRRAEQSEAQIAAFDRLIPLISWFERLVPPPFGQSLFATFVKCSSSQALRRS